jgi:F1F0 ATPase subunit 2
MGVIGFFAAGTALGFTYFLGLWITIRHIGLFKRPRLLSFATTLVRLGIPIFIFILLAQTERWDWILSCLAGFMLVRVLMVRRLDRVLSGTVSIGLRGRKKE